MNTINIEGKTIFIVDDKAPNLNLIVTFLKQHNYIPVPLRSGEELLNLIKKRKPDLILLDIMMPDGINGYETCRLLKQDEDAKNIPVIFMSALNAPIDKVKGFNLGCVDYITKPVEESELFSRIKTHLRLHLLQKEMEDLNIHLEDKVKQRTEELDKSNASLRELLHEKEIILNEVHDRVKNNLQVIIALLILMKDKYNNNEIKKVLNLCVNRIDSIALIHKEIYSTDNFAVVNIKEYIEHLCTQILSSYKKMKTIKLTVGIDNSLNLNVNMLLPLGLILNELITNSIEHGFPGDKDGHITIDFTKGSHNYILKYSDNGIGFPTDFDPDKNKSLGYELIDNLSSQLKATVDLYKEEARIIIEIPVNQD